VKEEVLSYHYFQNDIEHMPYIEKVILSIMSLILCLKFDLFDSFGKTSFVLALLLRSTCLII